MFFGSLIKKSHNILYIFANFRASYIALSIFLKLKKKNAGKSSYLMNLKYTTATMIIMTISPIISSPELFCAFPLADMLVTLV